MTKAKTRELKEYIDGVWNNSKANIAAMSDNPTHPAHVLMIEKNKGYMLACEDILEKMNSK